MKYLTEIQLGNFTWCGPDIEADSWEEAETELLVRGYGAYNVIGEYEDEYDY